MTCSAAVGVANSQQKQPVCSGANAVRNGLPPGFAIGHMRFSAIAVNSYLGPAGPLAMAASSHADLGTALMISAQAKDSQS